MPHEARVLRADGRFSMYTLGELVHLVQLSIEAGYLVYTVNGCLLPVACCTAPSLKKSFKRCFFLSQGFLRI